MAAAVVGGLRSTTPRFAGGGSATRFATGGFWRIAVGSALVVAPQICLVGFMVLFLHDTAVSRLPARRSRSPSSALGIGGRIASCRCSDIVGSRLGPLRGIALVVSALVLVCAVLVDAPLALLVPALIAAGAVAMSWNGLAFAAAIEAVGHRRSGVAIGLQQSVLNGFSAVYPGLFGALVGASSWTWGFLAVAGLPLLGRHVLRRLPG